MTRRNHSEISHHYATDVASGKILASKWLKLACQRYLNDLHRTDSRWHYDASKADRVCTFIESLTLPDSDSRFILQPFQCWLVCSLMGFVDNDGLRKHIEALILIPKGNGKSPLAAALGLWFAFFDGKKGSEIFTGAISLKQAMEVFKPALAFVESRTAGFAKLGIEAQKKSIFNLRTGSFFQPVIGKGRHGARPYLAILDELHQALGPDLYDTLKTGCNKVVNSLLLTISTAGVVSQANPCYRLQEDGQKVLDGVIENDRLFVAIWCADDSVEWSSPEALRMANPNLGISNDSEKIRLAQLEAVRNPGKQNNVKAMHLNVWSTASTSWMNMQRWQECYDPSLTAESVKGIPCWLGSDLASKLDLSATVRIHRQDIDGKPHYYCFARCYLPDAQVGLPENQHYQQWMRQEHLTATPGSSIDYATIESDTLEDISKYQVRELGYDARYADEYAQRVSEQSGIPRVVVPPNPGTLSPAMKELEAAVYDKRFHHDGHPVLAWCMSNVMTRETPAGNYTMPDKSRAENKIDAAVALFIAMCRAMLAPPTKKKVAGIFFI